METVFQLAGAGLVLVAFLLTQRHVRRPDAPIVLWLNACGAGLLALLAFIGRDWGFLALEGTWALIAAVGLLNLRRQSPTAATTKESR